MKIFRRFFVSVFLMMATALLLHAMSHGERVPLRESFATFPLKIDRWQGSELKLDHNVLALLRVDDYMLRQYTDTQNFPIEIYVGYYRSQREGATYHSPKNCLPGSGWTFLSMEPTALPVHNHPGETVEINKFFIQKGLQKQLVLYWYQDRGRIITSEYWAKIYMIWDAMHQNRTDGAFVRITVPFASGTEASAVQQGMAFAESVFPLLRNYLPS